MSIRGYPVHEKLNREPTPVKKPINNKINDVALKKAFCSN